MVQAAPSTYFRAFFDGVFFLAGDRILAADFAFGGCLPDWVAGAFFLVGTSSGSDSEMDSSDPSSPSFDSSRSDSESSISVEGGPFVTKLALKEHGHHPFRGWSGAVG